MSFESTLRKDKPLYPDINNVRIIDSGLGHKMETDVSQSGKYKTPNTET